MQTGPHPFFECPDSALVASPEQRRLDRLVAVDAFVDDLPQLSVLDTERVESLSRLPVEGTAGYHRPTNVKGGTTTGDHVESVEPSEANSSNTHRWSPLTERTRAVIPRQVSEERHDAGKCGKTASEERPLGAELTRPLGVHPA